MSRELEDFFLRIRPAHAVVPACIGSTLGGPTGDPLRQIFDVLGEPIVHDVFQGFNTTVFAYGQSGTGKSYTCAPASAVRVRNYS